jgi:hypothetical protein
MISDKKISDLAETIMENEMHDIGEVIHWYICDMNIEGDEYYRTINRIIISLADKLKNS